MKQILRYVTLATFAVATVLLTGTSVFAGPPDKGGQNGTTLAGYKTIDNDLTWRYSGVISVWNEGAIPTVGFSISDFIEYKPGTKWVKLFDVPVNFSGEIPAGTTQETALTFPYSTDQSPPARCPAPFAITHRLLSSTTLVPWANLTVQIPKQATPGPFRLQLARYPWAAPTRRDIGGASPMLFGPTRIPVMRFSI